MLALATLAACTSDRPRGTAQAPTTSRPPVTTAAVPRTTTPEATMKPPRDLSVIPQPVSVDGTGGPGFTLDRSTRILVPPGSAAGMHVAASLARELRRATGYPLPVSTPKAGEREGIVLQIAGVGGPGAESYRLEVAHGSVTISSKDAEGLFRGTQTLRQLLPGAIDAATVQPGPWHLPAVRVDDRPRYRWRGAALDVARHFFGVGEVERYLDLMALYKLNVLHLHLTDDQGWRLAVDGWPRLTSHGGASEVGGGRGGWYSKADYQRIVRYAAERFITVVPEIDMPGHVGAALSSYAELNCDGKAPELYTGTDVGFTSLCLDKPVTWRFLEDVIGELAALTPGPWLHIGGDEAGTVPPERYREFVERVQGIVRAHGKRAIGWQETATAKLEPTSVVQYWNTRSPSDVVRKAAGDGNRLVLSPASKVYLDMKYDAGTSLGLEWAGHIEVRDAYDWDPATLLDGVDGERVLGVEAQLWSETLRDLDDIEFMAFPRLPGVAEVGWSPASARDWASFRRRLAAQQPRWSAMSINYHRSPQIDWAH